MHFCPVSAELRVLGEFLVTAGTGVDEVTGVAGKMHPQLVVVVESLAALGAAVLLLSMLGTHVHSVQNQIGGIFYASFILCKF